MDHTDFEGYKAISNNKVHSIPKGVNGLKESLKLEQRNKFNQS